MFCVFPKTTTLPLFGLGHIWELQQELGQELCSVLLHFSSYHYLSSCRTRAGPAAVRTVVASACSQGGKSLFDVRCQRMPWAETQVKASDTKHRSWANCSMFSQTRTGKAGRCRSRRLDFLLPAKRETNHLLHRCFQDFQGTSMTLDLQRQVLALPWSVTPNNRTSRSRGKNRVYVLILQWGNHIKIPQVQMKKSQRAGEKCRSLWKCMLLQE